MQDSYKTKKTLKIGKKQYTFNSLRLAEKHGLKNISSYLSKKGKLVYFSSSEVYNGLKNNFNENYTGNVNYDNPRAPYIVGKKFGETFCNLKSTPEPFQRKNN